MVRVFQLSEVDNLMHSKILKNYEVSTSLWQIINFFAVPQKISSPGIEFDFISRSRGENSLFFASHDCMELVHVFYNI